MSQKSLKDIKLFVSNLMNEIQNEHSILVASLKKQISGTKEFDDAAAVLTRLFDAKIELLDKIYKEMDK